MFLSSSNMADLPSDQFQVFARYDQWANQRLYEACSKLDDGTYQKERPTFFTRRIPMAQILMPTVTFSKTPKRWASACPRCIAIGSMRTGCLQNSPGFRHWAISIPRPGFFPRGIWRQKLARRRFVGRVHRRDRHRRRRALSHSWVDLRPYCQQRLRHRGRALVQTLPIRLTPMTATCRVPPLSRVKLGIGWSRGVARDAEQ